MIATRTTPLSALFARIKAEMVSLGVWYSSPADEAAMRMWLKTAWLDCGCNTDFAIFTQPANQLSIQFSVRVATSGHRVNVYWGDGSTDSVAPATGSNTSLAKTYVTGALRPIIMLGRVTRFESVNNDGKTHFGGRITWLRSLTYLSWGGNNTGTGSVTGMPLTTLSWTGSNTGSGSVTGMPLTVLNWYGNNTGTGSVTGMPLTTLSWGGNNTGSGSVTGMPLTVLNWGGNNTGTGSITGMPLTSLVWGGNNTGTGWGAVAASATGLCYMYHGGLTVLDAAEVNAILAGFWANRNAAKSRADRTIDIGKDTPTPNAAPTGQGLTDKAALQAYRSPNNTGPAVWTVITN